MAAAPWHHYDGLSVDEARLSLVLRLAAGGNMPGVGDVGAAWFDPTDLSEVLLGYLHLEPFIGRGKIARDTSNVTKEWLARVVWDWLLPLRQSLPPGLHLSEHELEVLLQRTSDTAARDHKSYSALEPVLDSSGSEHKIGERKARQMCREACNKVAQFLLDSDIAPNRYFREIRDAMERLGVPPPPVRSTSSSDQIYVHEGEGQWNPVPVGLPSKLRVTSFDEITRVRLVPLALIPITLDGIPHIVMKDHNVWGPVLPNCRVITTSSLTTMVESLAAVVQHQVRLDVDPAPTLAAVAISLKCSATSRTPISTAYIFPTFVFTGAHAKGHEWNGMESRFRLFTRRDIEREACREPTNNNDIYEFITEIVPASGTTLLKFQPDSIQI